MQPPLAPSPTSPALEIRSSPHFPAWLRAQQISLALTTYQTHRLFLLGLSPEGKMAGFERLFDRPMALGFKTDEIRRFITVEREDGGAERFLLTLKTPKTTDAPARAPGPARPGPLPLFELPRGTQRSARRAHTQTSTALWTVDARNEAMKAFVETHLREALTSSTTRRLVGKRLPAPS